MTTELLRLLEDPRPEVRQAAADAFGRMGHDGQEVTQKLATLLRKSQGFVALRTATALAEIGDPRGHEYLKRQWASKKKMPAIYRKRLMESRAHVGFPDARALRSALGPTARVETRMRYLGYLAPFKGGSKASKELRSWMKKSDPTNRLYASIAGYKHPRTRSQALKSLEALCGHANSAIANKAAQALANERNQFGVDLLIAGMKSTELSAASLATDSMLMLGRLLSQLKEPKRGAVLQGLDLAFKNGMSEDLKLAAAVAQLRPR